MLFCRFRNPWGDAAEMVEEPVGGPRGRLVLGAPHPRRGCPTHIRGTHAYPRGERETLEFRHQ